MLLLLLLLLLLLTLLLQVRLLRSVLPLENVNAIKIQAAWRGYVARRQFRAMQAAAASEHAKLEREYGRPLQELDAAATVLQVRAGTTAPTSRTRIILRAAHAPRVVPRGRRSRASTSTSTNAPHAC